MDLLERVRQAAQAGQVGTDFFLRICELVVGDGSDAPIHQALHEWGLLAGADPAEEPTVLPGGTGSLTGHSGMESLAPSGSLEGSSGWVNPSTAAHAFGPAESHEAVVQRVQALRAAKVGPTRPPEKYELQDEIARGGVGKIHLVRDRDLLRTLVMKTLIEGIGVSDYVLKKFVEEAQITGQLEHPNIVPVHDFGYFSGGEVFFTMKLVKGRTLKDIIKKIRKGDAATAHEFSRTRLLGIFQQICMGIGFAHAKGVVHRDIKSSNVMVGDFGETLVLDWGVAKVLGRQEETTDAAVSTLRSQSSDATMMGVVTGTPAYMAPEQASGRVDEVDARSDVYSLGALLYEILTYVTPFRGKNFRETLAMVITQPVTPPSQRAPQNNVPRALEEMCLRCLEKKREDRFQSCKEIIEALEKYLSGIEDLERRERMSRERVDEGRQLFSMFKRSRAKVSDLNEEAMDLEWDLQGHEPVEQKRPLWSKQAELSEAESEMHRQFGAAAQAFMAALGFDPDNDDAANELARLYWMRMQQAEQDQNEQDYLYYRGLVEAYNRGMFDDLLRGEGRIIVRSDPAGAAVTASPFMEVDLKMSTFMGTDLGVTPLNNVPITHGAQLLQLSLQGHRDVVIPVKVEQGEVTDVACRFYTNEEIGDHFLYVPGGTFMMGGDETCASARHRRVAQAEDVFVARYPVTCGEYLGFVRDLDKQDAARAEARVPRLKNGAGLLWRRSPQGVWTMPAVDAEGFEWDPHWPVIGVSCDDAKAYCAWYTARAGVEIRLPTEEEWEKSARGTDGRLYPWGSRFDATFCKMGASRPGKATPERVGTYLADVSPYGVHDMAGLVSEYCDSPWSGTSELRVVKGGHYAVTNEYACRITQRAPVIAEVPSVHCGFRVVRDPPARASSTKRHTIRARRY